MSPSHPTDVVKNYVEKLKRFNQMEVIWQWVIRRLVIRQNDFKIRINPQKITKPSYLLFNLTSKVN